MDVRVATYGERLFWPRVIVAGQGCWLWDGTLNPNGYGQVSGKVDGNQTTVQAHRVAYELFIGPVPEGLTIDHLCTTRSCVRPDHLEAVTQAVNNRRQGMVPLLGNLDRHEAMNRFHRRPSSYRWTPPPPRAEPHEAWCRSENVHPPHGWTHEAWGEVRCTGTSQGMHELICETERVA